MKSFTAIMLALATLCLVAPLSLPTNAQDSSLAGFGKLDPSPPTGITPDEIIKKFGERETEFARARENYIFRQSVKVDTIDDDTGKVDGEYQQVTDITFSKEGKREEHVVFAPQNTLERATLQQQDLDDLEHGYPFVLASADLPLFNIAYLGRQKVDELDTYVFSAEPEVLDLKHRTFSGKVWVDQQDRQIVLVNGLNVPQDARPGHADLLAALHHLLPADRRQVLVPHLHQGRRRAALPRAERRARARTFTCAPSSSTPTTSSSTPP